MRHLGRYELWKRIAAGGMGAVHLGCQRGEAGFRRTVAIKSMHDSIAGSAVAVAAFIDEARLAARLRHPNIVSTLDVALAEHELIIVMDYVHGESLSRLVAAGGAVPMPIAIAIASAALRGLHAAHEATGDDGQPLDLVHRDVSPQNILVGVDGVARVADFGIAKAAGRIAESSSDGALKGKLAYMSPEQVSGLTLDRRTDIFALGVTLWETLTGERLFQNPSAPATMQKILAGKIDPPSRRVSSIPPAVDEIVMRALRRRADDRYASAREMADALDETGLAATVSAVGDWVSKTAATSLAERAATTREIERTDATPESLERLAESLAAGATPRHGEPIVAKPDETRTYETETLTTTGATAIETPEAGQPKSVVEPTRTRVSRTGVGLGLLVTLAVGVTIAVVYRRMSEAHTATSPPETAPIASFPPPPAPVETAAPVASGSQAPDTLELPPTPSAQPRAKPTTPRQRPAARPPDCREPYVRDELGRRIYKRECLKSD